MLVSPELATVVIPFPGLFLAHPVNDPSLIVAKFKTFVPLEPGITVGAIILFR
ncbi:hypothetical protein D3C80_2055410 [compost metagenome]